MFRTAAVKDTGAPLQLRDVSAALRKSDDVNGVLKALQQAGPLIAAAPDELSAYAGVIRSCGLALDCTLDSYADAECLLVGGHACGDEQHAVDTLSACSIPLVVETSTPSSAARASVGCLVLMQAGWGGCCCPRGGLSAPRTDK